MEFPGGKNGDGVYQRLINQIPPHEFRVELFLGSGAIARLMRPAPGGCIGIDVDGEVVRRWQGHPVVGLVVVQANALDWLQEYGGDLREQDFIYADLPYLFSTRGWRRRYRCEFGTEEEHTSLLCLLKQVRCRVMISGYPSELYGRLLQGWRVMSYLAQTRGGRPVTECAWMNYPAPTRLHDYRYLGANFRERERIRRRQSRWRRMLGGMSELERFAMLAALEQDEVEREGRQTSLIPRPLLSPMRGEKGGRAVEGGDV